MTPIWKQVVKRGISVLCCVLTAGLAGTAWGQDVRLPEYTRVQLDNGTVLILNEKHDVPLIGIQAVVRGGAVADPADLQGLSSLLASVMQKGAGSRTASQFAEAVDAVGGVLEVKGGLEAISVSAEFMARDADLMIELLADVLQRPALAADELEKVRDRRINFIRSAKDSNLSALLPVYANAYLFGEHPYGNAVSGSEASLQEIEHADLLSFYEQQFGADRLIIAVSGDFDTAVMQQKLSTAFKDWRQAAAELPEIAAAERISGRRVLLIDKPGAAQTYFRFGNVGVSKDYQQRADLNLANTLFGGRFTSMLNTALRVESGLTYGARSAVSQPAMPGSVFVSSFTHYETTVEAIDLALDIHAQLLAQENWPGMIESGVAYVLGQYPTAFETANQLARIYATLEQYGLSREYIEGYGAALQAATQESIAAAISEVYPPADDLVFVILGDAEKIREQVAKYGPLTEMSISETRFHPPIP